MSRRRITALAVLAAAAITALVIARLVASRGPAAPAAAATAGAPSPAGDDAPPGAAAAAPLPSELAELVAFLRARYGKHLASAYVQIQLIEKLMRHFQAKNPAGWQAELLAALRAAFPERYAELAAIL